MSEPIKPAAMLEQENKELMFFLAQLVHRVSRLEKPQALEDFCSHIEEYLAIVAPMPNIVLEHDTVCIKCAATSKVLMELDAPIEGFAPLGVCERCGGVLREKGDD